MHDHLSGLSGEEDASGSIEKAMGLQKDWFKGRLRWQNTPEAAMSTSSTNENTLKAPKSPLKLLPTTRRSHLGNALALGRIAESAPPIWRRSGRRNGSWKVISSVGGAS